jgi:hypothetical protein
MGKKCTMEEFQSISATYTNNINAELLDIYIAPA